ncbi:MAG: SLC13 family permease [Marinobacter sp.]|uniref:SLC13 family permease n=1 Tax=Marinobacter sp. TaxID=50741 RepID=UPI00299E2EEA|nr:SLC13 family permease [Marinobacter sp.]MDX1634001.1 SLC13 family permease [Marinobacter sp.]
MTVEIALVFLIIACALYLFATQKLPIDITALGIMVTVMAVPLIFHSQWLVERGVNLKAAFPDISEGLSGLANPATVTVLCMFILSGGIQRSGMIHLLAKKLIPLVGKSEIRELIIIGALIGLISGFINNTAAVAIAIPLMLDMSRRRNFTASRVLIPLSFFGMMGGTLTLIGTSTNILTSSILEDSADFGRSLGMFEFTHIGLIILAVGLLYFLTIGRLLLPRRDARPVANEKEEEFVVELAIGRNSELVGQRIEDTDFEEDTGADVLKLNRGRKSWTDEAKATELKAGDILIVHATVRQIMDLVTDDRVEVLSDFDRTQAARMDSQVVPILLRNRRVFDGRTAPEVDFWKQYEARLIGLDTRKVRARRLADEELHVGEVVLVALSKEALTRLHRSFDVVVLDEYRDYFGSGRMLTAAGIVVAVVMLAALTPLPIVLTALGGVIAMVVTGCIASRDMYEDVSWDVIFLLAGVIPLGIAMTKSGAADWVGSLIAMHAVGWHPVLTLMALYATTTVLTEMVSNNASAVILVPIAISLSEKLALEPLTLVLAVMFAASTSFLSPIGYQTNTMIYGTGALKFTDFARVGAPLNLILMVVTSCALYWIGV